MQNICVSIFKLQGTIEDGVLGDWEHIRLMIWLYMGYGERFNVSNLGVVIFNMSEG